MAGGRFLVPLPLAHRRRMVRGAAMGTMTTTRDRGGLIVAPWAASARLSTCCAVLRGSGAVGPEPGSGRTPRSLIGAEAGRQLMTCFGRRLLMTPVEGALRAPTRARQGRATHLDATMLIGNATDRAPR